MFGHAVTFKSKHITAQLQYWYQCQISFKTLEQACSLNKQQPNKKTVGVELVSQSMWKMIDKKCNRFHFKSQNASHFETDMLNLIQMMKVLTLTKSCPTIHRLHITWNQKVYKSYN